MSESPLSRTSTAPLPHQQKTSPKTSKIRDLLRKFDRPNESFPLYHKHGTLRPHRPTSTPPKQKPASVGITLLSEDPPPPTRRAPRPPGNPPPSIPRVSTLPVIYSPSLLVNTMPSHIAILEPAIDVTDIHPLILPKDNSVEESSDDFESPITETPKPYGYVVEVQEPTPPEITTELVIPIPEPENSINSEPKTPRKDDKDLMSRLREACIKELIETEESFISDLKLLQSLFEEPLKKVLPNPDHVKLFSNLDMILFLNQEFLEELKVQKESGHFGDLFLKKIPLFRAYKVYASNYDNAEGLYNRLMEKSGTFSRFMEKTLAKPECRRLPFNSFLTSPIRRVLKYPLLLKELLKNTTPENIDYGPLFDANKNMMDLVDEINQIKGIAENQRKIREIQESFSSFFWEANRDFQLIAPQRRFVTEADFSKVKRGSVGVHRYHYYLFNDLLLYGKLLANKQFSPRGVVPLDTVLDISITPEEQPPRLESILLLKLDKQPDLEMIFDGKKNAEHLFQCLKEQREKVLLRQEKKKLNASTVQLTVGLV
eukprot:TRINITY_DN8274_c0_g1_i1.p1 TRINITY_DN8274_c0_g1~~TRINITY_DN8274_c0_g1_i1.p1  ORF type:complete len:543 (-),score=126.87 TRINITY_DN8274_c0_g1_i1:59-1687(-)